jgi:hypothetical protein
MRSTSSILAEHSIKDLYSKPSTSLRFVLVFSA